MLLPLTFLAPFLLATGASPNANALAVSEVLAPGVSAPSPDLPLAPLADPREEPSDAAFEPASPGVALEPVYVPLQDGGLHDSRFTLKAGYYGADEDTLDDGYIFNASWMRFFTRFFALEFEAGYMDADGDDSVGGNTVDVEVWSVPLFVNGRFNAPLWILDVYGGAGVGTFYYDAEVSVTGLGSADDDGFLLAGNVFVGATLNVADRMALGLEAKYYGTEDIDDADEGLNGYALMLTLGFGR